MTKKDKTQKSNDTNEINELEEKEPTKDVNDSTAEENAEKIDKSNSDEIIRLQQDVENMAGCWKRALADYQNLKKESEAKMMNIGQYSRLKLFGEILPIIDHLTLACDKIPDDRISDDWAVGLKNIQKQFQDLIKGNNIEKMNAVGEPFDPMFHEAVGYEQDANKSDGVILKEVRAGYRVNGEVLFPALVIVNKNN